MEKQEIEILEDFINNENTVYCYDWNGFAFEVILPLIDKCLKENKELKQRIDKALKDIEEYKKIFNLDLFSAALENIEAKLRGEE